MVGTRFIRSFTQHSSTSLLLVYHSVQPVATISPDPQAAYRGADQHQYLIKNLDDKEVSKYIDSSHNAYIVIAQNVLPIRGDVFRDILELAKRFGPVVGLLTFYNHFLIFEKNEQIDNLHSKLVEHVHEVFGGNLENVDRGIKAIYTSTTPVRAHTYFPLSSANISFQASQEGPIPFANMTSGCEVLAEYHFGFHQETVAKFPSLFLQAPNGPVTLPQLDSFCSDSCSDPSNIKPLCIKGNAAGEFLVCYRNTDDRGFGKEFLEGLLGGRGWVIQALEY